MQALLTSTENIPELPTLIPAQIHNSPIPATVMKFNSCPAQVNTEFKN